MKKRTEIAVAGVVGAVLSVFAAEAANTAGLITFTLAVFGATIMVALALVIRWIVDNQRASRRRRETLETLLLAVASDVEQLKTGNVETEAQLRGQLAALREKQADDRLQTTEMLGDSVSQLTELLKDTALRAEQTRQLVIPAWLMGVTTWALHNGWAVTHLPGGIEFTRESEPHRTVRIVLPLGSHQEEEASRAALNKHLGHPERRGVRAQIGSMTRVIRGES